MQSTLLVVIGIIGLIMQVVTSLWWYRTNARIKARMDSFEKSINNMVVALSVPEEN